MKSTQNLSPGGYWHAEAESEVKNLQNFHPDLEMKENDLQKKNHQSVRRINNQTSKNLRKALQSLCRQLQ